ncbi:hypothetical protein SK224_16085 [Microbacterium sp. BG28]|nr:hypothetical protein [Microbacterium sp. BG28]MDY0830656.1 hypothetical protein [Microbacterium sp. BG28]
MLIGMVRPRETKTVDVTGASLEDVHQQLVDATPADSCSRPGR